MDRDNIVRDIKQKIFNLRERADSAPDKESMHLNSQADEMEGRLNTMDINDDDHSFNSKKDGIMGKWSDMKNKFDDLVD